MTVPTRLLSRMQININKKEIFIIIILACLALVRFFYFTPRPIDVYDMAIGEKVVIEGIVNDFPDERIYNQRITLKPDGQKFNILVVTDLYKDISYGDKFKIEGVLTLPENFDTDTGRQFNYKRYLANRNIYYIMKNPKMDLISQDNGNLIKSLLFRFRYAFIEKINLSIPQPESSLMNGILLGERGGFDKEQNDEFIDTGTIHIVALSGYNITVVANGIVGFFRSFLSATLSIYIGMVGIILFVILSGLQATAVRAGIMACIAFLGKTTGRNYMAGRALFIAGLLMIAWDLRTITDISFQLSFIATFGIIYLTPKTSLWLGFLPKGLGFRNLVATTLSATISVLPLILYMTGILSIISLPVNILILPVIPYAMFFGFASGSLGFIHHILATPFGYIGFLLNKYVLSTVHFFANLPFASTVIPKFSVFFVILFYIFLLWWVFKKKK